MDIEINSISTEITVDSPGYLGYSDIHIFH